MGTQGYAAPEYIMTGHLTALSDVYSFGVVLLELLTGRKSLDKTRPPREQNLVEFARPMLKDARKLSRIMDPRLEGQYSEAGACKAAALAYQCLSHRSKLRPTMSTVVKVLEPLKNFEDVQIKPFVYIAPVENDVKKDDPKRNGIRYGQSRSPRSPRSPVNPKAALRHGHLRNGSLFSPSNEQGTRVP